MHRLLLSFLAVSLLGAAPPAVTAVAWQPDGHRVAFGSHGEVRVFGNGGEATGVLPGQDGRVTALAYSPDGQWLAVASGVPGKAGSVRLYNSAWFGDPKPARALATLAAHTDIIHTIAFAPDARTLATAGYDRVIHLWDLPAKLPADTPTITKPKLTLKDHSDGIYAVSFHPDGKLLASASADRTVKIWDAANGQRLHTLGEPTDWLYALQWSPDKRHLAAAGVDKSIRVWAADRDGAKLVHAVFAHEKPVWRLGYSRDGQTLFSVGEDRIVKSWTAAKMVEAKVYAAMPDTILDFALAPDGKTFAVCRYDGIGGTFDVASGKPIVQMLPVAAAPPKPGKLAPVAVPRGKTSRVTITGTEVGHVRTVTPSHPGVTAAVKTIDATQLGVDISVKPDTPAGAVQLVVENEAGKSSPLTLIIDRYDAIAETGASDSARASQVVKLPVTVAGSIDRAGDVDFYRFEAKAGEAIGVQVIAAEAGSKLDPVLVLTDESGQVLAEGTTALGYTAAQAGAYSVGIRDREYRGAADMTYRLHIGDVPVVTGVFPLGVTRGRATSVHVEGVNLGPAAGQAVSVAVQADAAPGSRIPLKLNTAEPPLGNASVIVDEFPAVVVDPAAGAELRAPGTADGILLKPNDSQTVRFIAKKGERLLIEANARRLGSPVDPVIEILDAVGKPVPRAVLRSTARLYSTFRDHDAASPGIRLESWNELGIDDYLYADGELMRVIALPKGPDDDCQFYQSGGQRLGFLGTTSNAHAQGCPMYKVEIHPPGSTFPPNGLPVFPIAYHNDDGGPGYGKDSVLHFDPPADGSYQVRLSDARGAGGPTHAYRLTIRAPRPNFTISVSPSAPGVWKGGAVPIAITATRIDGFDGPIRVKLDGLPAGFSAPDAVIEKDQLSTSIALFAEANAAAPTSPIRLIATATIGGKDVTHEVTGGVPKLQDPGDIVTTTRQQTVSIQPGKETRLVVDVERRGDFKGRVPVEVRGLPHGVRVLNIGLNGILITERDTSREIVIYAEPWVQPMTAPFVVLARSERKGTEHAAKAVTLSVQK
jgi:WD40 repeat protein